MSAEQATLRRDFAAKEPLTIGLQPEPVGAGASAAGEDDATLVARAMRDRAAFGQIYDRYATRVFRYCYRRLGERELAEDATSQVFIKALQSLPSYRETGSFVGWLFAIAFSTTTDFQRRRRPTEGLDDADGLSKHGNLVVWAQVDGRWVIDEVLEVGEDPIQG